MSIYRKIYEQNYGTIPKDDQGRSYEIHHIDGNRKNNDISNLKCVSIQEHYDIHYSQGDWGAVYAIARRMNLTLEQLSRISSEAATKGNLKRVKEGTHPFLGGIIIKEKIKNGNYHMQNGENKKRVENGTHNFLTNNGGSENARKQQLKRVKEGIHPFVGDGSFQRNVQLNKIKEGTHHFLNKEWKSKMSKRRVEEGTHNFIKEWKCPHCGKNGKNMTNALRWHFDNCKYK